MSSKAEEVGVPEDIVNKLKELLKFFDSKIKEKDKLHKWHLGLSEREMENYKNRSPKDDLVSLALDKDPRPENNPWVLGALDTLMAWEEAKRNLLKAFPFLKD